MDEWIAGFARQGWHDQLAVLLQVGYAMLLGGAIGVERELKSRPAGFRTHMLVAGAAALLVGLGDLLANHYEARAEHDILRLDAMRLISAVVAAVGFLGAGAIFRRSGGDSVSGLTTAASLLMAATIGIAAGVHANLLALGATLLTLATLVVLSWIERGAGKRDGGSGPRRR
ncbi:MgtC/SapB family protein [Luteimonas sp. 50]|uniref:Protein MgtC n=1 Tax=Cognatiluteimonas sedimenti TaxID=2927791 RepID=A0ABT0A664_9GAMM|nr:MgtC/SapB family protein [Lysobacter sedimenti]MCJ0826479.1 MgtC/SapB family protein [Lysobacter sedimenti]